jgi:hypothetical protein
MFLFTVTASPAVGPIKRPSQRLPGVEAEGGKNLTIPSNIVPRLRINGAILALPHTPLWHVQCFVDRASQYISIVTDRALQYISIVIDRASQYISLVIDRGSQYISIVTDRASQYISIVTDRASQYISRVTDRASQYINSD